MEDWALYLLVPWAIGLGAFLFNSRTTLTLMRGSRTDLDAAMNANLIGLLDIPATISLLVFPFLIMPWFFALPLVVLSVFFLPMLVRPAALGFFVGMRTPHTLIGLVATGWVWYAHFA